VRVPRAAIAAAIALVFTLAACTGGDGAETNPAPRGGVETPGASTTSPGSLGAFPPKFLECMADQGIDVSSSNNMFELFHSPGSQQAFQACVQFLHGSGTP
jgi:hypothetical protein